MTMMMATQAMKKSTNRNKNIGMQWEKRFIWNFIVRSAKNSGLPTWD
jgi:hypothetical protein